MPKRERAMVPPAEFRSYYGRPVLKPPRWASPQMPGYLLLGGLAGASGAMAAVSGLTGWRSLARAGRWGSLLGAAAGSAALVEELGRPERFLNMLRVFKVTSPMSVGSWLLAAHGTLSGLAVAPDVVAPAGPLRLPGPLGPAARQVGRGAQAALALTGPALATYTAALLANTAVPAWHEARRELPFVFAGSAACSAAAVGMLAAPPAEAGPARRLAVVGALLELVAERRMTDRLGMVGEPYRTGRPGLLMRASRVLAAAGAATALLAGRPRGARVASAIAGVALLGGAACVRFAVYGAGKVSATDPRYVVVPQRERLQREADRAASSR
ncbi:Polysulfide reductase NrfD [Carbonactinospora thermoautotrophica]|uniref:Polysulfide reductase NrfD n=2 Tax=Carbonactinospora thermoautotrophica TaxID=1469144 RepID=A0A132MUB3_9ACTN|nr:NrfD/PsrC family molybdoenzyme membrane anchor subunit [Carbonactinospora thermoautotrophica]KWX01437.1 Polysulfide reductase NrfD [Carbonactinospora thermoautotrophica]